MINNIKEKVKETVNKKNFESIGWRIISIFLVILIVCLIAKDLLFAYTKTEKTETTPTLTEAELQQDNELKLLLDKQISLKNELDSVSFEAYRIVQVAKKEVGNVGGEKFWRWYGLNRHSAWCYEFVSWCAYQCGYLQDGTFKKFAACKKGQKWYQDNGHWLGPKITPKPGMIIFFDYIDLAWNDNLDGLADHVGIVEKVVNGTIYTIEGNCHDICRERKMPIGEKHICGYGVPFYYYDDYSK